MKTSSLGDANFTYNYEGGIFTIANKSGINESGIQLSIFFLIAINKGSQKSFVSM